MTLSKFLLKVSERFLSWLKTNEGHSLAQLGSDVRIGASGRIININGEKSRIKVGDNSVIRGEILTFSHEGRVDIGDWFYMGPDSTIWSSDADGVKIGDRVLISKGVNIHDTNSHPTDPEERFKQTQAILKRGHPTQIPNIKSDRITIGNDVWIGFGVTIFKGVTIGDRSIIGAGAIIDKDVPPDALIRPMPNQGIVQS